MLLCSFVAKGTLPDEPVGLAAESTEASVWDTYFVGTIDFVNEAPETRGSEIYFSFIPEPSVYITQQARKVLETLYFSPEDSIPGVEKVTYVLKDYKGISAKGGEPPHINIVYSTQWIEKSFDEGDLEKVDYESRGVLYHELTHGYQLEPQGIGTYGTNKVFWAFIEGMADAVRYVNGGFTLDDRPKGGNYMDGYRTAGFFFAQLKETKDPDFLRKFNRSTLEIIPWSFNEAIKHVLGQEYDIDQLWNEYMIAMGDDIS